MTWPRTAVVVTTALVACAVGCADTGEVVVTGAGNAYARDGIPSRATSDAWSITFSRALIAVSAVQVGGLEASTSFFTLDLTAPGADPAGRLAAGKLPTGLCPAVRFAVMPLSGNPSTMPADAAFMTAHGYSVYVEGVATRAAVAKSFAWGFGAATKHTCPTGATIHDGATTTVPVVFDIATLFLDDLVSPDPRLAFDLIASADADGDGVVTEAELREFDISTQDRYQVGGAQIDRLWDFIEFLSGEIGQVEGQASCSLESISETH